MSQIPYLTQVATDVITPDRGIKFVEHKYTPPPNVLNISCAGAGNSVILALYVREAAINEPFDSLWEIVSSCTITINGTPVSLGFDLDDLDGLGVTAVVSDESGDYPSIDGYVPLADQEVRLSNVSDRDLRILVEHGELNADQTIMFCLLNNPAAINEHDRSYTCLALRVAPTINCAGAPSRSPCFELNGYWDVEVNGEIIAEDVDAEYLLSNFSPNQELREIISVQECLVAPFNCVPMGRIAFDTENINMDLYNSKTGGDVRLHLISRHTDLSDAHGEEFLRHHVLEYDAQRNMFITKDIVSDWTSDEVINETVIGTPDVIKHYDLILNRGLYGLGNVVQVQKSMEYYTSAYYGDETCDTEGVTYQIRIALQNNIALRRGVFYLYNESGTLRGTVDTYNVGNQFKLKMGTPSNMVELNPYTFSQVYDQMYVAEEEREVLLHFASQISARGHACRLVQEPWHVIPNGFSKDYTPQVNTCYLLVETTDPNLYFTAPKQPNGTTSNPQNRNPDLGFNVNDPGLVIGTGSGYGADNPAIVPVSFGGCNGTQYFPIDLGYSAQVYPKERTSDWIEQPEKIELLSFAEADFEDTDNDVNLLDLFNINEEDRTIIACGRNMDM